MPAISLRPCVFSDCEYKVDDGCHGLGKTGQRWSHENRLLEQAASPGSLMWSPDRG